MTYGTIAHKLFQNGLYAAAASATPATPAAAEEEIRSLIAQHADELWALHESDDAAARRLEAHVRPTHEWAASFLGPHAAGTRARVRARACGHSHAWLLVRAWL
jgi:hypothetical protein